VSPRRERSIESDGLLFFGTLAASVTHELNNVLSIVDQARGLLNDLIVGAGQGHPIDSRRLETIQERIDRQVRKGVDIVNRLNRFAHSLDDPDGPFDAGAETRNLVSLARRFADLKKVRLECTSCDEETRAGRGGFALQQAIFVCLQKVFEASAEGDRIEVGVRGDAGDALVSISATVRFTVDGDDELHQRLDRLMGPLGGSHRIRADESGGVSFELRLPTVAGAMTIGDA
jgi:C4-dicarboxylate-specific signal transduction histidine kinase